MSYSIILLTSGIVGGAEHRFIRLFTYLIEKNRDNFFFFVTPSLKSRIKELYPDISYDNIISIGNCDNQKSANNTSIQLTSDSKLTDSFRKLIKRTFPYHLFYFLRSRWQQYKRYQEIEQKRRQLNITCFIGVFSGILPLYFYLNNRKVRPGVIFCNMDSWFANISQNPQKEWYRKYVSFNYAHEKSDLIDFLSPFIYEGVQKLGVIVDPGKVNITPCSFIDYSKCQIGVKSKFRIAFSGRLEKDKNPIMFMQAATILGKEFPDVEFHIMGEGRLSGTISEHIHISRVPNIFFYGFHPNPPEIFAESSLFVSIQTSNNYPSQSVLEAMACGNAIIATDVGDTRMFVNELNGTLIPLELNALIEAIREYIKNPQSALRKGLYASENVKKEFTIEKAADYYLSLFERAAQKMQLN